MSGLVDADRYLARAIYMPLSVTREARSASTGSFADGLSRKISAQRLPFSSS